MAHWTQAQVDAVLARGQVSLMGEKAPRSPQEPRSAPRMTPDTLNTPQRQPEGKNRVVPYRTTLEARFASEVLDPWSRSGQIVSWAYETVTLRLGYDCRYTPDFVVERADGAPWTFYETKGHRWAKNMVKLRVAATQFPRCRFWLVEWQDRTWQYEEIPSR